MIPRLQEGPFCGVYGREQQHSGHGPCWAKRSRQPTAWWLPPRPPTLSDLRKANRGEGTVRSSVFPFQQQSASLRAGQVY